MKKQKRTTKNEFRYNYNTKHTNYIFEDDGKNYHAVGITHHKKTFGKKNMPLDSNPQKGKKEKAYARNGIITDKKRNFSKKTDKRFGFSKSDKSKVKSKIRNFKLNRKKRK